MTVASSALDMNWSTAELFTDDVFYNPGFTLQSNKFLFLARVACLTGEDSKSMTLNNRMYYRHTQCHNVLGMHILSSKKEAPTRIEELPTAGSNLK